VQGHGLGVAKGQNQPTAFALLCADRAEDAGYRPIFSADPSAPRVCSVRLDKRGAILFF